MGQYGGFWVLSFSVFIFLLPSEPVPLHFLFIFFNFCCSAVVVAGVGFIQIC